MPHIFIPKEQHWLKDTLPPTEEATVDWSNPLTENLFDCRLYDSPNIVNLVDSTSDNPGTTNSIEYGFRGQDWDGTRNIALASRSYAVYTKYCISVPDAISSNNMLSGSGATSHAFWYTGSGIEAGHNGSFAVVSTAASVGNLYHTAVTYDGTNLHLFKDGVRVDTGAISAPGTGVSYIGAYAGSFEFNGRMFFTAIWDRALSDAEIVSLYKREWALLKPKSPRSFFFAPESGAFTLAADSGSYTYSGTSADLNADFDLSADSGSYTYTGSAADLNYGFVLSGDSGTYTYTGTNAELDADFVLDANSGTYTYSGTAADLDKGFYLGADSGAYTYTGTDVTLTFESPGSFTITADSGTYTYTGSNAELDADFVVDATSGTYTYSGTTVTLTKGFDLSADSGSYTYTGTAIAFDLASILSSTSGTYAYTGSNATLSSSGQIWTIQSNDNSSWVIQSNDSSTWTIQ